MNMLYRTAAASMLALAALFIFTPANAKVITIDTKIPGVTASMTDNERNFTLTFSGGEVKKDESFSVSVGEHWIVNFTLSIHENRGNNPSDNISLVGTAYHETHPHESGPGEPLNFGFLFDNDAKITFDGMTERLDNTKPEPHEVHLDTYKGKANANFVGTSYARDIYSWSATLQGTHPVPEPETGVLLICGMPILAWSFLSRRKA
jgi:hypothetical protein